MANKRMIQSSKQSYLYGIINQFALILRYFHKKTKFYIQSFLLMFLITGQKRQNKL